MVNIVLFITVGLVAGILGGMLGIGGGVIIVPALLFLFGLTQHEAQGTTLALMVPPIGLLAAWTYWKQGFVKVEMAAFICLGFFFGGLLGAKLATQISGQNLCKVFGVFLLVISLRMILFGR
ncbi:MAG: TSUP family transporter [Phycisphaerales bacterium]|nr:MAG: TSUP family transporter [Phycisphaerales bacterium]